MTFHVRYNDCHLEEDMGREGEKDWASVGGGEKKREVWREGAVRKGRSGNNRGWKWLRSPLVVPMQPKPSHLLLFTYEFAMFELLSLLSVPRSATFSLNSLPPYLLFGTILLPPEAQLRNCGLQDERHKERCRIFSLRVPKARDERLHLDWHPAIFYASHANEARQLGLKL